MNDFPVTIFHNPACGTSRKTLQALRDAGHEPVVVEYLKIGWTKPQLQTLLGQMKVTPRDILRDRQAADIGLAIDASDDAVLEAAASLLDAAGLAARVADYSLLRDLVRRALALPSVKVPE